MDNRMWVAEITHVKRNTYECDIYAVEGNRREFVEQKVFPTSDEANKYLTRRNREVQEKRKNQVSLPPACEDTSFVVEGVKFTRGKTPEPVAPRATEDGWQMGSADGLVRPDAFLQSLEDRQIQKFSEVCDDEDD